MRKSLSARRAAKTAKAEAKRAARAQAKADKGSQVEGDGCRHGRGNRRAYCRP